MKIGVSISTYSDNNTPDGRLEIIDQCLTSLVDNLPKDVYINIVSDGMVEDHRKLLNKFPFEIIERDYNGGISKVKNTGIKSILDNGCDIGFLCDDDLIFKNKSVFNMYSDAIVKTEIPHFCFFLEERDNNCDIIRYNDLDIKKTPWVNGCFLTFTKKLIDEIGYFKVMPYKYGHEHSNFTRRCLNQNKIPHYSDILNSIDYVDININSLSNIKSIGEVDMDKFKNNEIISSKDLGTYIKIEE